MAHKNKDAGGRDTNALRANKTRSIIIDAACDVLSEAGYAGFTASALVRQAGISKGGIYHHFDTMDDVVIAAYQKTMSDYFFAKDGQVTPRNFDSYLSHVEKVLFEGLFKNRKTMRIMHELLPRVMYDPVFGAKRKVIDAEGVERMVGLISGSSGGKIKKAQLRIALKSVSVFLSGLALHLQLTDDLGECKKMWAAFRKVMSEQMQRS